MIKQLHTEWQNALVLFHMAGDKKLDIMETARVLRQAADEIAAHHGIAPPEWPAVKNHGVEPRSERPPTLTLSAADVAKVRAVCVARDSVAGILASAQPLDCEMFKPWEFAVAQKAHEAAYEGARAAARAHMPCAGVHGAPDAAGAAALALLLAVHAAWPDAPNRWGSVAPSAEKADLHSFLVGAGLLKH